MPGFWSNVFLIIVKAEIDSTLFLIDQAEGGVAASSSGFDKISDNKRKLRHQIITTIIIIDNIIL